MSCPRFWKSLCLYSVPLMVVFLGSVLAVYGVLTGPSWKSLGFILLGGATAGVAGIMVTIIWIIALQAGRDLIYSVLKFSAHKVPVTADPKPLQAWKIANITLKGFNPITNHYDYQAIDAARCPHHQKGPPHEGHLCGFYGHLSRWAAGWLAFTSERTYFLLEVEMYGDRVLEGRRKVLRAPYQRVIQIRCRPLCMMCASPFPRPAIGFSPADKKGRLIPVCSRHRKKKFYGIETLRDNLKTEVVWHAGPLCRFYLRLISPSFS